MDNEKDENERLYEAIERLYRRLTEDSTPLPIEKTEGSTLQSSKSDLPYQPKNVWDRLTSEGNFKLIEKLHLAEHKEPGYNVIPVPSLGYSENDDTHNAVLDWLKEHNILALNPLHEISIMERSLHSRDYED